MKLSIEEVEMLDDALAAYADKIGTTALEGYCTEEHRLQESRKFKSLLSRLLDERFVIQRREVKRRMRALSKDERAMILRFQPQENGGQPHIIPSEPPGQAFLSLEMKELVSPGNDRTPYRHLTSDGRKIYWELKEKAANNSIDLTVEEIEMLWNAIAALADSIYRRLDEGRITGYEQVRRTRKIKRMIGRLNDEKDKVEKATTRRIVRELTAEERTMLLSFIVPSNPNGRPDYGGVPIENLLPEQHPEPPSYRSLLYEKGLIARTTDEKKIHLTSQGWSVFWELRRTLGFVFNTDA